MVMEENVLIEDLYKSKEDVVKGSYFLTPVESLDYMMYSPTERDADPMLEGVFSPGTLLYFDRKENSVWYGGDGLGYIFLIQDKQDPLIWEVEKASGSRKDKRHGTIRITKKDLPDDDSWEHHDDFIYHQFYTLPKQTFQVYGILNWFGSDWKTLLEESL